MEVKEDFVEDLLPYFRQLMGQLVFEGSDPRPSTCPKTMHHVMELYRRPDPPIYDPRKCLPQHLGESNTSELPIPLRNEEHHLPITLYR